MLTLNQFQSASYHPLFRYAWFKWGFLVLYVQFKGLKDKFPTCICCSYNFCRKAILLQLSFYSWFEFFVIHFPHKCNKSMLEEEEVIAPSPPISPWLLKRLFTLGLRSTPSLFPVTLWETDLSTKIAAAFSAILPKTILIS